MDERVIQFRLGLLVLVTFAAAAVMITLFSTRQRLFRPTKKILVHFPEAPGVSPNTPVRKNGILIGRVARVQLADEVPEYAHLGGAIVTLEIDRERKIFTDEDCWIRRTLLGDAIIEFVRRRVPTGKPPKVVAKREEIQPGGPPLEGRVATDPLQFITELQLRFSENAGRLAEIIDQTHTFVTRLNALLGTEEELQATRQRVDQLLENTNRVVEHADALLGDEQLVQNLRETTAKLPQLVDELQQSADALGKMATTIDTRAAEVAQFTQTLQREGSDAVTALREASEALEQLLVETNQLVRKIQSNQGTIGRLMNDPQLYDNLNEVAIGLQEILTQARPIMQDLRVFSDKIARHPELVGVRGALRGSPGTKQVPTLEQLQGTSTAYGRYGSYPARSWPR